MFIGYMFLWFAVPTFCMETDNRSRLGVKKSQEGVILTYDNQKYQVPIENIDAQEGVLLHMSTSSFDMPTDLNSVVLKHAITALTLHSSKILNYFFDLDNGFFYDICNFYDIIVPSTTFKNNFYNIMILKSCLQYPALFNIKAYMFTLDEAMLLTKEYDTAYKETTASITKINNLKEHEITAEIKKQLDQLTKSKNTYDLLRTLIPTYIGNTFLYKRKFHITQAYDQILQAMFQGGICEESFKLLKEFIEKKGFKEKLPYKEHLNINTDDTLDLTQKVVSIPNAYEWVNKIIPIYQWEKALLNTVLDESKILSDEAFALFLKHLPIVKNTMLDLSYISVTELTKYKLLYENIVPIFINNHQVKQVKLFCDSTQTEHANHTINLIYKMRNMFPNLEEIYFTNTKKFLPFADAQKNEAFTRAIFYTKNHEEDHYVGDEQPSLIKIFIPKDIYEATNSSVMFNFQKQYDKHRISKKIYFALVSICVGSCLAMPLIILWYLICRLIFDKKDINFFLHGIPFVVIASPISCLSYVSQALRYYGKSTTLRHQGEILHLVEKEDIIKKGQYIFSYDPTKEIQ